MRPKRTPEELYMLCQDCATTVYGQRPPTPAYATRVARLLFGTAAQESGLQWERQRSVSFDGPVGGFGKWQVERGSIRCSLDYLRDRPDVLERATAFLFDDPGARTTWVETMPLEAILWALRLDENDALGVLFARIHYFMVAESVPESVADQARYWKVHYNTIAGGGNPAQYVASWQRFCAAVAGT